MTEKTIFGSDQDSATTQEPSTATPETPVTPQVTAPVIPPELAEYVGEGKKYRSLEDAYKSIPNAQSHISNLEKENSEFKAELAKRKAAEELLEDIRKSSQPTQATPQGVEVNKDVVSEIVKHQINIHAQETTRKQNTELVVNSFVSTYGDKAKAEVMFAKVAADNGMTISQMEQMVATTPKAVLNLAGLNKTSNVSPSIRSDVNTQAHLTTNQQSVTSKVSNYGSSSDVMDGMRRAKEIVNQRLKT